MDMRMCGCQYYTPRLNIIFNRDHNALSAGTFMIRRLHISPLRVSWPKIEDSDFRQNLRTPRIREGPIVLPFDLFPAALPCLVVVPTSYPKSPRTHFFKVFGPKARLYRAVGLF